MKIGILSRNYTLYSTRQLVQSARLRGHEVTILDTLKIALGSGVGGIALSTTAGGYPLPIVDGIIPRIGASITTYGLAVVRRFEMAGVATTAVSQAIAYSRDKLKSLERMNQAGLPVPKTVAAWQVASQFENIQQVVEFVGGLPVIVKFNRGTQGRGVILAPDIATLEALLKAADRFNEEMLIQEFIAESEGQDTRVIIVEHDCVAAMQRTAAVGDFRSNLHQGGTAVSVALDQPIRKLALKAAQAHNLGVAGVDIINSKRGPLLLEVNSSPGLEGIERTTGIDVATKIVCYLEREIKKKRKADKRRKKRR